MENEARIKSVFGLKSPQDDKVVLELSSLCSLYSMTPDNLKFKWEAFALNTNCPLKPTLPYMKFLKNSLQREFERSLKSRRTTTGKIATKRMNTMDLSEYGIDLGSQDDSVESFISGTMNGAVKPNKKVVPLSNSASLNDTQLSEISSLFITRKASHVLDESYNGHLPERGEYVEQSLSFKHLNAPIEPYRYMYEKTNTKAETMDEVIDYIGGLIAEEHHIESYANPTRPIQEPIYAYGRISPDSSEGNLNEKSVLLQTSRDLGMGRRIRLDISKLESYDLFPGQVIGVRGMNHHGDVFFVEEIFMPPVPQKPHTEMSTGGRPVEVITAAGPFTLDDDLSFQPLEDLLKMCTSQQPDVILLMGPFISSEHPKIKKGGIQSLPEDIFRDKVIRRLEHLLETCQHTRVLIAPHANDMVHPYCLFPQPPFANMTKHSRVHMLSNPASFSINDHTISVGNIDILLRMAKSTISKSKPNDIGKFQRLSQQILQQRSYYPLFPRAIGDSIDSDRIIDIQLSWKPDILILPSQFKHFAKNVDGTVCINPGHLCKNLAAGTYSKMTLYPTLNEQDQVRVDLYKL